MKILSLIIVCILLPLTSLAGEADVLEVVAEMNTAGSYTFDVTVQHADTGWDHYANKWDIIAPDGTLLGTRTLYHPHVNEQPFTRSLSRVKIPSSVTEVTVRAHDSVHEYGGKTITINLDH